MPKACKLKPKPKPTSKAKSMATTKTAGHSRSGIDSKDSGEWFHINDDFTMPDSNASRPTLYEATDASHLVGYGDEWSLIVTSQRNPTSMGLVDAFARFRGGCELENPESRNPSPIKRPRLQAHLQLCLLLVTILWLNLDP
ncbi:hypothetical protein PMIN04_012940 [Paraphaeosphaeria minitans]|uniref:Uncharacterized protein n=1 Tax=Paraphaeosphaeria minitans TaxID=565426 RepID=A0A9P6KJD3_9PLEO|nr:hypothetical protein PMIN01_13559 [Paraphaeosphaeria minitans]